MATALKAESLAAPACGWLVACLAACAGRAHRSVTRRLECGGAMADKGAAQDNSLYGALAGAWNYATTSISRCA